MLTILGLTLVSTIVYHLNSRMNTVEFLPQAAEDLLAFKVYIQKIIRADIRTQLEEGDPREETRNKQHPLDPPSPFADYELRVQKWRVFYWIEGETVVILRIGVKEKNRLRIGGEEIRL